MTSITDYDNGVPITWCPGCGNFAILKALQEALVAIDKSPHQILIVSGIGQAAKFPHYMRCNALNGLHGRSLPMATAAKIANHALTVIVVGGDGDCYAEGGNHFLHAIRRNPDITFLVHNNQVYGLTRGQPSPTCERGFVTKVQPHGVVSTPLNPLALAISQEASFVGRGYAGSADHLKNLIKEALLHRGFSFLDILQPCVSFDHKHSYSWYEEKVYPIDPSYDPRDKYTAFKKAEEWDDNIPLGILYKKEKPTFEELQSVLKKGPLITQTINRSALERAMAEFI